ncbi:MAG: WYL domain-containing protein [Actinomycetota bacterium]
MAKLESALGIKASEALDIHLGEAESSHLDELRSAANGGEEVRLVYYSYGRDDRTERIVAPWRVFADSGSWYVQGWCHRAEGERVFRVDRIEELERLHTPTEHGPPDTERAGVYHPRPEDPTVDLELGPEAAWVADYYPVEILRQTDSGLEVRIVVSALPWLERLLIRLGPDARVSGAEGLTAPSRIGPDAAARVLARYRSEGAQ